MLLESYWFIGPRGTGSKKLFGRVRGGSETETSLEHLHPLGTRFKGGDQRNCFFSFKEQTDICVQEAGPQLLGPSLGAGPGHRPKRWLKKVALCIQWCRLVERAQPPQWEAFHSDPNSSVV